MRDLTSSDLSRRSFLARSTAAAGAPSVALLSQSARSADSDADPNRKLGFAFVGIGSLCMHQLLPGIVKSKRCKPVALVSGHPAKANDQANKYHIEEHCNFQLRFPSGVLASCASSYNTGLNRFVAHCTRGSCSVEPGLSYNGVKFHIEKGQGVQSPSYPDIDQFAAEMDAFADCIPNNTPSHASGEEGLQDLRIIEAIYESARTGKTVELGGNA